MNATALSSAQLSSSSSSWVSGNVWLWTCVLTPHTLAAIRRHGEIETLASREPNYWINLQGDEDSPRCVAEQTVREVHERVMRGFIRERGLDADIKGIEYWYDVLRRRDVCACATHGAESTRERGGLVYAIVYIGDDT